MSSKRTPTNRVHEQQLWDARGRVWTLREFDADPAEVEALVGSGAPIAVHGFGRPMRWVEGPAMAAAAAHARRYEDDPDEEGLVYTPCVWTSDGDRLLTFQTDC